MLSIDFTGEVAVVSNDDSPRLGSSSGFSVLEGHVALESDRSSVLIADSGMNVIHRVYLATGARANFVEDSIVAGARSVVVDNARNRAIVAAGSRTDDGLPDAVAAYDLTTGERTVLSHPPPSGLEAGSGVELMYPYSLALDELKNAVLVFDAELDAIVSIDLITLERSVLVDASTGNGDHLSRATNNSNAFVLDAEARVVYAVNEGVGEVLMVDLTTGDQVVIAR